MEPQRGCESQTRGPRALDGEAPQEAAMPVCCDRDNPVTPGDAIKPCNNRQDSNRAPPQRHPLSLDRHKPNTRAAQPPLYPSFPVREGIRHIFPFATPPWTRLVPAVLENTREEEFWRVVRNNRDGMLAQQQDQPHSRQKAFKQHDLLMPFQASAENKKGQTLPSVHSGVVLASLELPQLTRAKSCLIIRQPLHSHLKNPT